MRTDWNTYFMEIANAVKTRSTCERLNVGCVLTKDNRIIATGYNGSISGHPHCDEDGIGHLMYENGCKRTIHAELNALLQCAKNGVATNGATAYVTHYPCPDCMKSLNQAGIKKVYYNEYYPHRYRNEFDYGLELFSLKEGK